MRRFALWTAAIAALLIILAQNAQAADAQAKLNLYFTGDNYGLYAPCPT